MISILNTLPSFYFLLDKFSKGSCNVEKILDETFDGKNLSGALDRA